MKFESFQAGVLRQRYRYKSFEPVPVNHEWVWEDASNGDGLMRLIVTYGCLLVNGNVFPLT